MIEKTYTMIKPDGVRNGHIGEIVNRFERVGLTVERMELGMVSEELAKANYAEHEGKPFYEGLIAAPGTIRGDFGLTMDENVIHGSDSVASAEREIGVFFG